MSRFSTLGMILLVTQAESFQIDIDLNTYTPSEVAFAAGPTPVGRLPFRANGTWTIENNSPNVTTKDWRAVIEAVGSSVFSEDNPESVQNCKSVRSAANGRLTATFQYHETGGVPGTMLNYTEISEASAKCGNAGVIILTRAFWPNSAWRTKVVEVLDHPLLYGVAMEFNPNDYGKRFEGEFVKTVLAAGKSAFFLLPFSAAPQFSNGTYTTEDVIGDAVHSFATLAKASAATLDDERVHIVLARYDHVCPALTQYMWTPN